MTDAGNAKRFARQYGNDLLYCYPWKKWLKFDGRRWARDDRGAVETLAKQTALSIFAEASLASRPGQREALAKHAVRSESEPRIRAMVVLGRSEPGIPALPDAFDRDPWAFNVLNGTLDLRTGTLRPHRRADLITRLAPIHYNPNATCPLWDAFLERIFSGKGDLITFMQRALGVALTGDVSEQYVFIEWGKGANGKSTLNETIRAALGEYARTATPELLIVKKGEPHPTERADLAGRRFVTCAEIERGRDLAQVFVKQSTGGDEQIARRMREDFWTFAPTAKIWLATNHKPRIKDQDHAIWRRILLIPFEVEIPEPEQDKRLPEKLRAELSGILAWLVKGCLAWQLNGLRPPKDVLAATKTYREQEDSLGRFLAETCDLTKTDQWVGKAPLFAAYEQWCKDSGESPVGPGTFRKMLLDRDQRENKTGKRGRHWVGIRLLTEAEQLSLGIGSGDGDGK